MRDRIRVYRTHCATWRINHPSYFKPPITDLDGVKAIGREVREKKFTAMKTNVFIYEAGAQAPQGWRPGFGVPFYPELNVDRNVLRNLRMHLEAIREGAGPDVDLLLDLNFNAKTEGYLKILREIADLDMFWIEIDTFSPEALGRIRRSSPHPISSCETLLGLREFLPYFREQAVDVAIIDAPWNGVWQSMKIAASAEAHEVNVAPHNFYGHLCTMMNAHFPPPCRTCASWRPRSTAWPGTTNWSTTRRCSRTVTSWCRTGRAGAASPTRTPSAPTRPRPATRSASTTDRRDRAARAPLGVISVLVTETRSQARNAESSRGASASEGTRPG